jgi:hypothetical protein
MESVLTRFWRSLTGGNCTQQIRYRMGSRGEPALGASTAACCYRQQHRACSTRVEHLQRITDMYFIPCAVLQVVMHIDDMQVVINQKVSGEGTGPHCPAAQQAGQLPGSLH